MHSAYTVQCRAYSRVQSVSVRDPLPGPSGTEAAQTSNELYQKDSLAKNENLVRV